jgi:hypothetical protein
MRWTLAARKTGARTGGRPSRVVLAPRRWCQVCARARRRRWPTSPEHRGDHGAAVNTIACGNAGFSGGLVVTNSCGTNFFPREAAGALDARHSPRPLIGKGGEFRVNLAHGMRRECGGVSRRHCERSEAIHSAASGKMDCFAYARNDGFAVCALLALRLAASEEGPSTRRVRCAEPPPPLPPPQSAGEGARRRCGATAPPLRKKYPRHLDQAAAMR